MSEKKINDDDRHSTEKQLNCIEKDLRLIREMVSKNNLSSIKLGISYIKDHLSIIEQTLGLTEE